MTCRLGMDPLHTESPRVLAAPLPHRSLPYTCLALGTASPSCPPHLSACPMCFFFFFVTKPMLMDWRIGTFRKYTLKRNAAGPEATKEGFHCLNSS